MEALKEELLFMKNREEEANGKDLQAGCAECCTQKAPPAPSGSPSHRLGHSSLKSNMQINHHSTTKNGGPHSHKMAAPSHLRAGKAGHGGFRITAAGKPQALQTERGEQGMAASRSRPQALQTEPREEGMAASGSRQPGSPRPCRQSGGIAGHGGFLIAAAGKPQALQTEQGEQGMAAS
ncbi:hypothetical protein QTO34_004061 [Cnephaeus nilssonii]|uniref:Uncharacterized protein n=1 Tax=Cnephaeus nilssonii TaxID=3371016 RepID=A0AA40LJY6_CNENI|nr:hypothetical protein QTO34_004061 [Eptesicus nilssonii]